jgi:hypothetical protein
LVGLGKQLQQFGFDLFAFVLVHLFFLLLLTGLANHDNGLVAKPCTFTRLPLHHVFRLQKFVQLAGLEKIRTDLFTAWVMVSNPPAVQGFTSALRFIQGGKHRFT